MSQPRSVSASAMARWSIVVKTKRTPENPTSWIAATLEMRPANTCKTGERKRGYFTHTLLLTWILCSMEGMPPCWSSIHARALQHRAVVRSDVAGNALCLKTDSKTAWLILTRPWARPYPRNSAQSLCKLPTCWIQWGECLCLTLM